MSRHNKTGQDKAKVTDVGSPRWMTGRCKQWVCGWVKADGSMVEGKTVTRGMTRRRGKTAASNVGWSQYTVSY